MIIVPLFWVLCINVAMVSRRFLRSQWLGSSTQQRQLRLRIMAWAPAFVLALLPLMVGGRNVFGALQEIPWCWLRGKRNEWRLVYYATIWTTLILVTCCVFVAWWRLRRPESKPMDRIIFDRLIAYPIVLLVVWCPISVVRFMEYFATGVTLSPTFVRISGVLFNMQGLANSIIFGLQTTPLKRLRHKIFLFTNAVLPSYAVFQDDRSRNKNNGKNDDDDNAYATELSVASSSARSSFTAGFSRGTDIVSVHIDDDEVDRAQKRKSVAMGALHTPLLNAEHLQGSDSAFGTPVSSDNQEQHLGASKRSSRAATLQTTAELDRGITGGGDGGGGAGGVHPFNADSTLRREEVRLMMQVLANKSGTEHMPGAEAAMAAADDKPRMKTKQHRSNTELARHDNVQLALQRSGVWAKLEQLHRARADTQLVQDEFIFDVPDATSRLDSGSGDLYLLGFAMVLFGFLAPIMVVSRLLSTAMRRRRRAGDRHVKAGGHRHQQIVPAAMAFWLLFTFGYMLAVLNLLLYVVSDNNSQDDRVLLGVAPFLSYLVVIVTTLQIWKRKRERAVSIAKHADELQFVMLDPKLKARVDAIESWLHDQVRTKIQEVQRRRIWIRALLASAVLVVVHGVYNVVSAHEWFDGRNHIDVVMSVFFLISLFASSTYTFALLLFAFQLYKQQMQRLIWFAHASQWRPVSQVTERNAFRSLFPHKMMDLVVWHVVRQRVLRDVTGKSSARSELLMGVSVLTALAVLADIACCIGLFLTVAGVFPFSGRTFVLLVLVFGLSTYLFSLLMVGARINRLQVSHCRLLRSSMRLWNGRREEQHGFAPDFFQLFNSHLADLIHHEAVPKILGIPLSQRMLVALATIVMTSAIPFLVRYIFELNH
eukprot:TRINITY_DN66601_c7_g1_i1.p1 TRINITY_DN66601_c7_g1~~TRINITY_DN66601_c7_g1_i1.p1  ORF type:complete len:879 (-),score=455.95 TRINITY_DN66601_c7_g1_i1:14-2650(-)